MKVEHTDTYFETVVSDPYNWMEDMQSTEVKNWVKEENEFTEEYLSKITFREKIKNRLTELWNYPRYSAPFKAGEYYFFYKNDGLQNQDILYRQIGIDGTAEIFLDPNTFSSDGTVALAATSLSWDNKYLAYNISRAGSDWQEIYIINVETKEKLKDCLNGVKFSAASWLNDGFFYNRYDVVSGDILKEKNESPKIYFHKIGNEQNEDLLIYEDEENRERNFYIYTTEDQTFLFKSISQKNSKGNALYYRDLRNGNVIEKPLSDSFENQYFVIETVEDEIYLFTNKGAPKNKIVKFVPSQNEFVDLIPESENVLSGARLVNNKLIAVYMKDASEYIYVFDNEGNFEREVKLPTVGTVSGFDGRKNDKYVFYNFSSLSYPPTIYIYDTEKNTSSVFRNSELDFDTEEYDSCQLFYPSRDGTKIPLFLVYKKGIELNGNNPTLLYGYGGFKISQTPEFSNIRRLFLENGGVYALACLRGGGEYGDEWHEAGTQLNKQNVFDDFIAAAEFLIKEKYTSSKSLAIQGASNGGLLVGAVINQRPELFKVALPAVGVMDMLRYHNFTIGWAWISDYGSSEDPIHFENLYSYSPLHNIKSQNYPATLITTSDHDDRVVPLHSYKYAAKLQEMNTGENPVLIRVETDAGHGAGKPISKSIEEQTDVWSFVFYNLGMRY